VPELLFRDNVGLVILNSERQVFWGARKDRNSWQFPQGGMEYGETPTMAMYRELKEEVGLSSESVVFLAESREWLSYEFPKPLPGLAGELVYGQRQKWFLLKFIGKDLDIDLNAIEKPEFKEWRWVDYWYPIEHVVPFKKLVYQKVLHEFAEKLC